MKKSQCYRVCRGEDKQLLFVLTDSFLEVVTDGFGNSYNIHFHKVNDEWSATEESSGMKCVPGTYRTRSLCYAMVQHVCDTYKRLLSTAYCCSIKAKLKEFKEKENVS